MTMITWQLTIYGADARTIVRQSEHRSRMQAQRSIRDYECRHGRHAHNIQSMPMPGSSDDAQTWDDWRTANGIAAR